MTEPFNGHCPQCGQRYLDARLQAAEIALADVRTLDEWASDGRHWYSTERFLPPDWQVVLSSDDSDDVNIPGPTPDAARHAAAEWVRGQK